MDYTNFEFNDDMENGYGEEYYRAQYPDSDDDFLSNSYRGMSNNHVITSTEDALSYFRRQEMQREERQKEEARERKLTHDAQKKSIKDWMTENKDKFNKIKKTNIKDHNRAHNLIEKAYGELYSEGKSIDREQLSNELEDYFNDEDDEVKEVVRIFLHPTDPHYGDVDKELRWIIDQHLDCKCYNCCGYLYHPKTKEKFEEQKKQLREEERLRREKEREREREKEKRRKEKLKQKREKERLEKEKEEREKERLEKEKEKEKDNEELTKLNEHVSNLSLIQKRQRLLERTRRKKKEQQIEEMKLREEQSTAFLFEPKIDSIDTFPIMKDWFEVESKIYVRDKNIILILN